MIETLQSEFPDAELEFSSATPNGKAFIKNFKQN